MQKLILEEFLPYRMNRAAAAISRRFRAVYGPHHDLTVPEWRVLATLGEFGHMTAKQIGVHSSMHKTKVSRAVADLESRRWLSRSPNPADRREEILSLTTLGRNTYGDIIPRAVAFERMILERLGADAEAFLSGLSSLEAELAGGRNDVET